MTALCPAGRLGHVLAHLASLGVAPLALHLRLHQRIVSVAVHIADAAAQLGQAGPGVAIQLVKDLPSQAYIQLTPGTLHFESIPSSCVPHPCVSPLWPKRTL